MSDLYGRQQRYYHQRADEYDRGAWQPETAEEADEVRRLVDLVAGLPPARTLDVGCGTGFLSQHLHGEVTLLDASEDMLAIAAERVPAAVLVQAEAPPLPFPDGTFERVFSSHFYDHLMPAERRRFLAEATRVAPELVLVQQRGDTHWEGVEQRTLEDGSVHEIYKVLFTTESLLAEVGAGELLYDGPVFLMASVRA
ncbi:MAG TPA: class I SAM-dependent methyltransferase [Gaiellaceae bacterium]|nr:class I SAM-dependent methyltransferase [Gaiellaceae bacterium]